MDTSRSASYDKNESEKIAYILTPYTYHLITHYKKPTFSHTYYTII